jgi:hypothetical protein
MAGRLQSKELADFINEHMAERMFLVSTNITAADIVVFTALAPFFAHELKDFEKIQLANAFRWIDHIQHLPGLLEQVQAKGLFTSFPDENAEPPSKAQLKKLAKLQAAKEAKDKKKAEAPATQTKAKPATEAPKQEEQKQAPKEETKQPAEPKQQPKKQQ